MKEMIYSEKAPKPAGAYSQGVFTDRLIFVSGQLPIDPATSKFVEKDITKQTRQIFKNIEQVLAAKGAKMEDIVKLGVFLLNLNDFKEMNEVFQEFFTQYLPARTTVSVKEFPQNVLIEIDAIALKS